MKSLNSVARQVRDLLEKNEELRSNDIALIVAYCRMNGLSTDLADHIGDGCNFAETVRRARQKAQMDNPFLKPINGYYRKRRKERIEKWVKS